MTFKKPRFAGPDDSRRSGGAVIRLDPRHAAWEIVCDGVMGGLSRASVSAAKEALSFEGSLSTANGGGFASIRCRLELPVERFHSIRLAVSGDGRRYQLRLRESDDSHAPAWRYDFATDGTVQDLAPGCSDFSPVFRGRPVGVSRPLETRCISHVGFMLADRRDGPFRLLVHDILLLGAEHTDA